MMQTSEKTDKIVPAFIAAEHEVGAVKKTATNPHFKSKYADLDAVMDACSEALKKNGLAVWQSATEDGARMVTRLYHESGQWIEGYTPLIVAKNDMQGLGSAYTYARRYGLMAALGIAPEDDDGNAASPSKAAPAAQQKAKAEETPFDEPDYVTKAKAILAGAPKVKADEWESYMDGLAPRLDDIKAANVKTYNHVIAKLGEIEAALRIAA
jgi:hypothetical protein